MKLAAHPGENSSRRSLWCRLPLAQLLQEPVHLKPVVSTYRIDIANTTSTITFHFSTAFCLTTFNSVFFHCHSSAALDCLGSVSLHNGASSITARGTRTPRQPVTAHPQHCLSSWRYSDHSDSCSLAHSGYGRMTISSYWRLMSESRLVDCSFKID